MRKAILLIGNTHGLPGVKVDLRAYRSYFKSDRGGQWYDEEITECLDFSRSQLILKLSEMRTKSYDYVIVVYSGHGGSVHESVLEINAKGDMILESELTGIATRQLTILDCCRTVLSLTTESLKGLGSMTFSAHNNTPRKIYEDQINKAAPQEVILYACQRGGAAVDTPEGGVYSRHLLRNANRATRENLLYISDVHELAARATTLEYPKQMPEIIQGRFMKKHQLIIGVNTQGVFY